MLVGRNKSKRVDCRLRIMPTGSRLTRAGKHGKRPRIRRITPEQFRETREFTGKSREDVAEFLGVSLRTVGHWETGKARVPYAAFRLLRVALRGDMLDPSWQGYRIARGRLVTPEGYAFGPGDMAWLSLLVARAGFQSLVAIARRAALQSGGCSRPVDGQGESVGGWDSLVPCVEAGASSGKSSGLGLPSSNRGVSETEREARQGHETRTTTAFEPNSGRSALPEPVGPEWGHNGAIQSEDGFAHDGTSQAQFAASSGSVRSGSGRSRRPARVAEHVHLAGVDQLPAADTGGTGQARFPARARAINRRSTGTRRPFGARSASDGRQGAACAQGRKESALSLRKPQAVQALSRQKLKSGGAA